MTLVHTKSHHKCLVDAFNYEIPFKLIKVVNYLVSLKYKSRFPLLYSKCVKSGENIDYKLNVNDTRPNKYE